MKNTLKAYTSFTRKERIGILMMLGLLVLLLIVRITMPLWVSPSVDNTEQEHISKAWENYKSKHLAPEKKSRTSEEPLTDIININTADSATLIRLKGIGEVNVNHILAYRKNYGRFTDVEQIHAICTMPAATFNELKKHISLTDIEE